MSSWSDSVFQRCQTSNWIPSDGGLPASSISSTASGIDETIVNGPPLERWHTYVPHEMRAKELDAADWNRYLAEEARIFAALRSEVTQKLDPEDRVPFNRYFDGSPVYPARFSQDFNRSYVLEPAGPPRGAVVLLH